MADDIKDLSPHPDYELPHEKREQLAAENAKRPDWLKTPEEEERTKQFFETAQNIADELNRRDGFDVDAPDWLKLYSNTHPTVISLVLAKEIGNKSRKTGEWLQVRLSEAKSDSSTPPGRNKM